MRDRVVIVSDRDDIHARVVVHRLRSIAGRDDAAVLFDTATFPVATTISFDVNTLGTLASFPALPDIYGGDIVATLRDTRHAVAPFALARTRSVYWRRPRPSLIDTALEHPQLRGYAAKSSRETIEGLVECLASERLVVDRPSAVARASLKVWQLSVASHAGFAVPRTLVTNDAVEAARFVKELQRGGAEAISKSPADLRSFPARTELVDEARLRMIEAVRLCPTILQERIVGPADVRIVTIGNRVWGIAQTPSPAFDGVDSRMDPAPQRRPFTVSEENRERLLAMQRRLGLLYGAYDFKCDASGALYFLEVNPVGQWLPVEVHGGHQIAEALASLLWNGLGGEWTTTRAALDARDLMAINSLEGVE